MEELFTVICVDLNGFRSVWMGFGASRVDECASVGVDVS